VPSYRTAERTDDTNKPLSGAHVPLERWSPIKRRSNFMPYDPAARYLATVHASGEASAITCTFPCPASAMTIVGDADGEGAKEVDVDGEETDGVGTWICSSTRPVAVR
jgi:hypothetical protein